MAAEEDNFLDRILALVCDRYRTHYVTVVACFTAAIVLYSALAHPPALISKELDVMGPGLWVSMLLPAVFLLQSRYGALSPILLLAICGVLVFAHVPGSSWGGLAKTTGICGTFYAVVEGTRPRKKTAEGVEGVDSNIALFAAATGTLLAVAALVLLLPFGTRATLILLGMPVAWILFMFLIIVWARKSGVK